MPRPRTHDDALRARLLDRAATLVSEHGTDALGLRGLAADVGTSTTAVYSLFGGKPELVRELGDLAERRFTEHLRGADGADPVALGMAYRRAALADPHLYAIMSTPGLAALREAAGVELGTALWGMAHGLLALDLAADQYERALHALVTGWR